MPYVMTLSSGALGFGELLSVSCPAGELVSVALNEVVRLQCPAASRLSHQVWERPNSRLSSDLYLHLEDGSLCFVATPATLGHYLCLSTENGYQQTMAVYQVKQKSSPVAQTPVTYTRAQTHPPPTTQTVAQPGLHTPVGTLPKRTEPRQREAEPTLSAGETQITTRHSGRNFTKWMENFEHKDAELRDREPLLLAQGACYLKELVIVSVLLVLCLSVLFTVLPSVIRKRCRTRTAPQAGTPTRERRSPVEQEALRGGQFLSNFNKGSGHAPHNGHASGVVCNAALLKDANGHLPNTPI